MSPSIHIGKLPANIDADRLIADSGYAATVLWGLGDSALPIGCWAAILVLLVAKSFHISDNAYVGTGAAILALALLLALLLRHRSPTKVSQMSETFRIDASCGLLQMGIMGKYGTPFGPADPERGQPVLLSKEDIAGLAKFIESSDIADRSGIVRFLMTAEAKEKHMV